VVDLEWLQVPFTAQFLGHQSTILSSDNRPQIHPQSSSNQIHPQSSSNPSSWTMDSRCRNRKVQLSRKVLQSSRVLPPALASGKMRQEEVDMRLIQLAQWFTIDETSYWTKIYAILELVADLWEEDIHEIALPDDISTIERWDFVANDWALPGFQINMAGLQGTLTKEIGKLYNEVCKRHYDSTKVRLATWGQFRDVWSSVSTFFFHYRHLHRELSKKEAHDRARQLGAAEVTCAIHTKAIIRRLLVATKQEYLSAQVQYSMMQLNKHEPEEDDPTISLGPFYYTFVDELDAQDRLKEFLVSVDMKLSNRTDMIKASKKWWQERLPAATADEKESWGILDKIYSRSEVAAAVTAATKEKKKQAEAERKKQQEAAKERKQREEALKAAKDALKAAKDVKKADDAKKKQAEAAERKKQQEAAKERKQLEEALKAANAKKADDAKKTADDAKAEAKKKADAKKADEAKKKADAKKADDAKAEQEEASAAKKRSESESTKKADDANVLPGSGSSAGSVTGGSAPVTPVTGGPILLARKDTATTVDKLVPHIFVKPEPQWHQMAMEAYGMVMNFVNSVQIKGFITPAFLDMARNGTQPAYPALKEIGALVMMALGVHDVNTMGTSLNHFGASLTSWIPPLYLLQCGLYLAACYQIFTSKMLYRRPPQKSATRMEVDAVCQEIFERHHPDERVKLEAMKQRITSNHELKLQGKLNVSLQVGSFTPDEETLIQANLSSSGPATEVLRQLGKNTIRRESLQMLCPKRWLNDEVINLYTCTLSGPTPEGYKHCHSSHFMAKLLQDLSAKEPGIYDYNLVKKWSKTIPGGSIFGLSVLAIPINFVKAHWACVIVSFKEKRIQFYDSRGSESDGTKYVQPVFQYLQDEHKAIKETALPSLEEWRLIERTPSDLPKQTNGFDCGIYCCSYIDFVFNNRPMPSTPAELAHRRLHIALRILQLPPVATEDGETKGCRKRQRDTGNAEEDEQLDSKPPACKRPSVSTAHCHL
jgi:hypothetical protein